MNINNIISSMKKFKTDYSNSYFGYNNFKKYLTDEFFKSTYDDKAKNKITHYFEFEVNLSAVNPQNFWNTIFCIWFTSVMTEQNRVELYGAENHINEYNTAIKIIEEYQLNNISKVIAKDNYKVILDTLEQNGIESEKAVEITIELMSKLNLE